MTAMGSTAPSLSSSTSRTEEQTKLTKLPPELLGQIVAHFDTARTLSRFSQTCKRLALFIESDGYRVFVQSRFPSIQTASLWKDAARSLTTISKAWDHRSLLARPLKRKTLIAQAHDQHTEPRRYFGGQTIGYHPLIDCFEEQNRGSWSSRKEVLAYGAGSELMWRTVEMGEDIERAWMAENSNADRVQRYNHQHHRITWKSSRARRFQEGRDDITFLHLIRACEGSPNSYSALVGRASGLLEQVSLSDEYNVYATYSTQDRPIRAGHCNGSQSLLAAGLANNVLAIYDIDSKSNFCNPLDELTILSIEKRGRIWSTQFLDDTRLAVGLGTSLNPIHIYAVTPSEIRKSPLRTFATHQISAGGDAWQSVYPIVPLGTSSQAGGSIGDLFLSGWIGGDTRLHDMRSPAEYATLFRDPIDRFSSVYSLLPVGREHFVAGTNRHSLIKIFDLRMPGGKSYYAVDVEPCRAQPTDSKDTCCGYHAMMRSRARNYNVFLNNDSQTPRNRRRGGDSPVYSLCAASASSPTFYAGVQNNVLEIDLVSMMDQYPDPIFKYSEQAQSVSPGQTSDPSSFHANQARWNSELDLLNLAVVEHTAQGAVELKIQQNLGAQNER